MNSDYAKVYRPSQMQFDQQSNGSENYQEGEGEAQLPVGRVDYGQYGITTQKSRFASGSRDRLSLTSKYYKTPSTQKKGNNASYNLTKGAFGQNKNSVQNLRNPQTFSLAKFGESPASNYRKYKATAKGTFQNRHASLRSSEASTQKQNFTQGGMSLNERRGSQQSNQSNQPRRLNTVKQSAMSSGRVSPGHKKGEFQSQFSRRKVLAYPQNPKHELQDSVDQVDDQNTMNQMSQFRPSNFSNTIISTDFGGVPTLHQGPSNNNRTLPGSLLSPSSQAMQYGGPQTVKGPSRPQRTSWNLRQNQNQPPGPIGKKFMSTQSNNLLSPEKYKPNAAATEFDRTSNNTLIQSYGRPGSSRGGQTTINKLQKLVSKVQDDHDDEVQDIDSDEDDVEEFKQRSPQNRNKTKPQAEDDDNRKLKEEFLKLQRELNDLKNTTRNEAHQRSQQEEGASQQTLSQRKPSEKEIKVVTAPTLQEEDESLVIEYKNPNFHGKRIPSRFQTKDSQSIQESTRSKQTRKEIQMQNIEIFDPEMNTIPQEPEDLKGSFLSRSASPEYRSNQQLQKEDYDGDHEQIPSGRRNLLPKKKLKPKKQSPMRTTISQGRAKSPKRVSNQNLFNRRSPTYQEMQARPNKVAFKSSSNQLGTLAAQNKSQSRQKLKQGGPPIPSQQKRKKYVPSLTQNEPASQEFRGSFQNKAFKLQQQPQRFEKQSESPGTQRKSKHKRFKSQISEDSDGNVQVHLIQEGENESGTDIREKLRSGNTFDSAEISNHYSKYPPVQQSRLNTNQSISGKTRRTTERKESKKRTARSLKQDLRFNQELAGSMGQMQFQQPNQFEQNQQMTQNQIILQYQQQIAQLQQQLQSVQNMSGIMNQQANQSLMLMSHRGQVPQYLPQNQTNHLVSPLPQMPIDVLNQQPQMLAPTNINQFQPQMAGMPMMRQQMPFNGHQHFSGGYEMQINQIQQQIQQQQQQLNQNLNQQVTWPSQNAGINERQSPVRKIQAPKEGMSATISTFATPHVRPDKAQHSYEKDTSLEKNHSNFLMNNLDDKDTVKLRDSNPIRIQTDATLNREPSAIRPGSQIEIDGGADEYPEIHILQSNMISDLEITNDNPNQWDQQDKNNQVYLNNMGSFAPSPEKMQLQQSKESSQGPNFNVSPSDPSHASLKKTHSPEFSNNQTINFNNEGRYPEPQSTTYLRPNNDISSGDLIPVKDKSTRRMTEKHQRTTTLENLNGQSQEAKQPNSEELGSPSRPEQPTKDDQLLVIGFDQQPKGTNPLIKRRSPDNSSARGARSQSPWLQQLANDRKKPLPEIKENPKQEKSSSVKVNEQSDQNPQTPLSGTNLITEFTVGTSIPLQYTRNLESDYLSSIPQTYNNSGAHTYNNSGANTKIQKGRDSMDEKINSKFQQQNAILSKDDLLIQDDMPNLQQFAQMKLKRKEAQSPQPRKSMGLHPGRGEGGIGVFERQEKSAQPRVAKTKEELAQIRKNQMKTKFSSRKSAQVDQPTQDGVSNNNSGIFLPTDNEPPLKMPSDELMSRLGAGKRVKVEKEEMKKLTAKNYAKLPEIMRKKEEAKKNEEMLARKAKTQAYQRELAQRIREDNKRKKDRVQNNSTPIEDKQLQE